VAMRRFPESVAEVLLGDAYEPGLGGPRPATSDGVAPESAGRRAPSLPAWLPVVEVAGIAAPVEVALAAEAPVRAAQMEAAPAEASAAAVLVAAPRLPRHYYKGRPCCRCTWRQRGPGPAPRAVLAGHSVLRALARLDRELGRATRRRRGRWSA